MNDGDALRRAVIENPDEDTPRLIYADWLDENAHPERAAFIRAQIEAARAEPFGPQARAARAKADALEKKHRMKWRESLDEKIYEVRFSRGFVEGVMIEADSFVSKPEELFAAEPVQSLQLAQFTVGERVPLEAAFGVPQLSRIRRLGFAPLTEFGYDQYEGLTASPHLDALTDLVFQRMPIHPPWFSGMLMGDRLPALVGLDVADISHLGPSLADAFVRTNPRRLRRLDVSRVAFLSDHLRRVLTSPCLQQVEELRLAWEGLRGSRGPLTELNPGWVIPWQRLAVLDLTGQRLGDEGVKELVKPPNGSALRWLGLRDNALTGESVRAIVAAKQLKLFHLDVSGNDLKSAHIEVLKERFEDAVVVG